MKLLYSAISTSLALATADPVLNKFTCTDMEVPPMATTISELHPGHVSLVMSVGDSISAAFAARGTIFEDRDIAWSGGKGEANALTLPYLLNQYGVPVEGASTTMVIPNGLTHLPHGDYHRKTDNMNVAESSGNVEDGSLTEQWEYLLEAFPKYQDFEKRWKVLTVWMTANDVCGQCNGPVPSKKLDDWVNRTEAFLYNVSSRLTNVYVNLIPTLDLSNIHRVQEESTSLCSWEHTSKVSPFSHECGCIDRGNSTELASLDSNVHLVNEKLHEIADGWYNKLKNEGREDMAVVAQGFQEFKGKECDRSFLSTLDCFHPSKKAHQDLAIALWNSMLCIDDRTTNCGSTWPTDPTLKCPTKESVFYTGPDVKPKKPAQSQIVLKSLK